MIVPNLERCARAITPKSSCTVCVDLCPTHAISIEGSLPKVNSESCTLCCICITHCPLGSLELDGWKADTLVDIIREKLEGKDALSLSCKRSAVEADLTFPCLGMVTPELLMAVASVGATLITFYTENCQDCSSGSIKPLYNAVDDARKLMKKTPEFRFEETSPKKDGVQTTIIDELKKRSGLMGRREFITFFRKSHELEEKALPPTVEAFLNLSKGTGTLFYIPKIGEKCNGCLGVEPLCVKMCPTGALSKDTTSSSINITILPGMCTSCRICEDVCPEGAIKTRKNICKDEKTILKTIPMKRCSGCGRLIPGLKEKLCPFCENRKKFESYIEELIKG